MLTPDLAKWNQSTDDLLTFSVHADHYRTRERFMALHHLATVGQGATVYARRIGRDPQTVMEWVRAYNRSGPDALAYVRSGGCAPLLTRRGSKRFSASSPLPYPATTVCRAMRGRCENSSRSSPSKRPSIAAR